MLARMQGGVWPSLAIHLDDEPLEGHGSEAVLNLQGSLRGI